jgi:hypothetical protein
MTWQQGKARTGLPESVDSAHEEDEEDIESHKDPIATEQTQLPLITVRAIMTTALMGGAIPFLPIVSVEEGAIVSR